MKNELGIEVCCKNCIFYSMGCKRKIEDYCKESAFIPVRNVYEARIKELQEQQFTMEELHILRSILQDYFRVYTTQHYRTEPLLKKIEQTLKNSEENLNKQ